jgi:SSS family solute:Na+ symporter
MMWILSYIRQGANIGLLFTAVACLAFMKLPIFAEGAAKVTAALEQINNVKIQSEMAVPIFLAFTLPIEIKALFLAGMISAAISTLDTYFLTWAGVFTQDIVSPLRSRDFTVAQRLKFLKWSVVGIATFVFIFSVLWKPTQYIWMYFAITGSIYTGGAGAVILGALYWKGGTKQGAWSAMIIGSSLSVSSIVILQMFSKQLWWPSWINGMLLSILASACAVVTFIIVSVFTGHEKYDIRRLLNRLSICDSESRQGKYIRKKPVFEMIVGVIAVLLATGIIGGFLYSRTHEISSESWVTFWKWYSFILFGYSLPITVWFLIGGFVDVKILIQKLRSKKGDLKDDGQIHSNSA